MRTEWQKPQSQPSRSRTGRATEVASSSWTARRAVGVGGAMAMVCLVGGVALARLTSPGPGLGAPAVVAVDDAGVVEPEIGDAVTATRAGPLEPAPVEDLLVVRVSVNACGDRSVGTAVQIADGLLLTAAHVVGDATLVRIDHGSVTVAGEVLGVLVDGRDLALVAVDAPLADSVPRVAPPEMGEAVTLVGFPEGERRAVTVGPRVDLADEVLDRVAPDAIAVGVATGPGFSGGPAVGPDGRLFGIAVAAEIATETAIVLPLDRIERLDETVVVPGHCATDA